jgi:hypothetical protein
MVIQCNSNTVIDQIAKLMNHDFVVGADRRMSPDLPRGTVNLIGGELDVDEPRLRTNKTSQSLHHCSVGYHLYHMDDLTTKAYPSKRNQERKQEQEMQ